MLKIIGRADVPQSKVELDPYVPFIVRLGEENRKYRSRICYFQPDDKSIFEIWLDGETAEIHRVALVIAEPARRVESGKPDDGPRALTKGNAPVADASRWEDPKVRNNFSQLTVADSFEVVFGKDFVSVRFTAAGAPKDWIVNDKSRFGVDAENRLCRFDLINLSAADVSGIRAALD